MKEITNVGSEQGRCPILDWVLVLSSFFWYILMDLVGVVVSLVTL